MFLSPFATLKMKESDLKSNPFQRNFIFQPAFFNGNVNAVNVSIFGEVKTILQLYNPKNIQQSNLPRFFWSSKPKKKQQNPEFFPNIFHTPFRRILLMTWDHWLFSWKSARLVLTDGKWGE